MNSSGDDPKIKPDTPLNPHGGGGMRNVTALGLVSFFTDFSTEMVL